MTNKTDGQRTLLDTDTVKAMSENPVLAQHYARAVGGMFIVPKDSLDPECLEAPNNGGTVLVNLDYEAVIDKTYSHTIEVDIDFDILGYTNADGTVDMASLRDHISSEVESQGFSAEYFTEEDCHQHDFEEMGSYENGGSLNIDLSSAVSDAAEIVAANQPQLKLPTVLVGGREFVVVVPYLDSKEEEALKIA